MKSTLLLPLLALALVACQSTHYIADVNPNGTKHEEMRYLSLGGSEAYELAGGTRYTGNRNKSFGQAAQAITAIAGGISATATTKSNNALAATKDTNAAATAQNASNNAAATAQNASNNALKGANVQQAVQSGATLEVAPINPNP